MTQDTQSLDSDIAGAIRKCASSLAQAITDGRRTCVRCIHFEEHAGEQCALAHSRPPARVIAYGCAAFSEDDIPF